MTEPTRSEMEYLCYAWVTGEREKAYSVLLQSVQTFPRNVSARVNLSSCLAFLGQPDKADDEAREAARLQPSAFTYIEWTLHSCGTAQTKLGPSWMKWPYESWMPSNCRTIAFGRLFCEMTKPMQEQGNQAMGRPDPYRFLLLRSYAAECHGPFRRARELIQQAADMAPGTAAEPRYEPPWTRPRVATQPAGQIAATALRTINNREGKLYLALAFARAGNIEQARKMGDALDHDSPLDMLVQNYSLPTIPAAMKLNANDPAGAIAALQPSLKCELSFNFSFNGLYPENIRGLAYLQLGEGRLAAAEFQKLVDHRGWWE
jgi:tetratricopeptide (TPR) repeat protein